MLTMRAGTRRRVVLLLHLLGGGAAIGAVLGAVTGFGYRDAPLLGACLGAIAAAITGVLLVGAILGTEIFLPSTRLGHALERAPFLVTFATKLLVYGAVIVLVVGNRLSSHLVGAVTAILPVPELAKVMSAQIAGPRAPRLERAFLLLGFALFMVQMSRLIGERTLGYIVLGRYHRPRTEERFFLFVDIVGSTPLAERVGPDAVHRFLGEVFRLASDPIDDYRGEVFQYVGDEIVITWTVAEGREHARPLACFVAIEQALERAVPQFERKFGSAPRIHAALHASPVIAGEVGGSRRAIVYHGDVMNTTSRIEQATRDLERQFLVSADALERLDGLEGFAREDLGLQRLRGRAAAIQVIAVTTRPSTNGNKTI